MPIEINSSFRYFEKAAAQTKRRLEFLEADKLNQSVEVCDEILAGPHNDQSSFGCLQTGSGNNLIWIRNEVIHTELITF